MDNFHLADQRKETTLERVQRLEGELAEARVARDMERAKEAAREKRAALEYQTVPSGPLNAAIGAESDLPLQSFGPLTFSKALELLKLGVKLSRLGWNGKGQFVQLQPPTTQSKMTRRYLFIKTADGELVPWVASQSDLLAEDWVVVQ